MSWRPSKPLAALLGTLGVGVLASVGLLTIQDLSQEECESALSTSEWSVARHWNEANLSAIRRDLPAPTVHARNLFHASAAMWDAWAAYDDSARGVFVNEAHSAADLASARNEAISYAAFRVLEARYLDSVGATESIPEFDQLMQSLCYPIDVTTVEGDSPAAIGNRVARTILEMTLEDGANEREGYVDPTYQAINPPLVVAGTQIHMSEPNRWQPLQLEDMISQNGIPVEDGVQEFVDPHWGYVDSFALPAPGANGLPLDPGPPPYLGDMVTDSEFKEAVVEVIRYSSILDPDEMVTIDISPASIGDNSLGANDGDGHDLNPATGSAFEPNMVNQADFGRVLAEFWADGPDSETPPGHWNTVANTAADNLAPDLRIGGSGPLVDRLEWDVKLYLALNGANHDAAIAAWGAKRHYDYVRPISMIRYMGNLGQSSDPSLSSYHPDGLPLVENLIELITPETTVEGGRHESLLSHEGQIAVRTWAGNPENPEAQIGGVGWIRAVQWVPYQQPTFVTPAFAGYVSGHSTFSRASAEILAAITGSEYFPGGIGEWTIADGSLEFEEGPEGDITLQWATYADAADQAGLSRLYGGIHVRADDFEGRRLGFEIGRAAWEKARVIYAGDSDF